MRFAALVLSACVGTAPAVYRPDVLRIVQTESDKAVQIVVDDRLPAHEPRPVPPAAVVSALIASGMFLEDDARLLASPIARHLETMQSDESVRIIGWAADAPRYYYVQVHNNRLQITYYAGNKRSDDYSGVIPSEAVAIHVPREPVNEPIEDTPAPPDAGAPPPASASEPAVAVEPKQTPAPVRKRQRRPPSDYKPISEAEARRRMRELDDAMNEGLITQTEHRAQRKAILARL